MAVLLGGDVARSGIILSEEDEDDLHAQLPAVICWGPIPRDSPPCARPLSATIE